MSKEKISIHSPSKGRDKLSIYQVNNLLIFQSNLPARGETVKGTMRQPFIAISIHSPSKGRDMEDGTIAHMIQDFNPLSQQGERHKIVAWYHLDTKISIHSPSKGRDANIL